MRKITDEEYFKIPAVSASLLGRFSDAPIRALVTDSEPSKSQRLGTLVHKAILEPTDFRSSVVVSPDFGDLRSSKNREARDAFALENTGRLIVTNEENRFIANAIEATFSKPLTGVLAEKYGVKSVGELLAGAFTEATLEWEMSDLKCKAKLDAVRLDHRLVIDLKTTASAKQHDFAKSIWNYGYDKQAAWYLEALTRHTGLPCDDYVWLAVENTALEIGGEQHVGVAVYHAPEEMLARGHHTIMKLFEEYRECAIKKSFPFYPDEIRTITYPGFVKEVE